MENETDTNETRRFLKVPKSRMTPYVKELRNIVGVKSAETCILIQYLEDRFSASPNGFETYLSPSDKRDRGKVSNIMSDLGFNEGELRGCLEQVCTSYSNRALWQAAQAEGDIFQGKLYCKYAQRSAIKNYATVFYRNHALVEATIARLVNAGV